MSTSGMRRRLGIRRAFYAAVVILAGPAGAPAQTPVAELRTKLGEATTAISGYEGTAAEAGAPLTTLISAIDALRKRSAEAYLRDLSDRAAVLLGLLKYQRAGDVLAAANALRVAVDGYDDVDPVTHFQDTIASAETLLGETQLELIAANPILRGSILKLHYFSAEIEHKLPNLFVASRAVRLEEMLTAVAAQLELDAAIGDLSQSSGITGFSIDTVGTSLADLEAKIAEIYPATTVARIGAQVDRLDTVLSDPGNDDEIEALRGELRQLADRLDAVLGPSGPRLRILHAMYGDFRSGVPEDRKCNITKVLREKCDGLVACTLPSEVADDTCGAQVAAESDPAERRLSIRYACPSLSPADWRLLTSSPRAFASEVGGSFEAITLSTRVLDPTLRCVPRGDPATATGLEKLVDEAKLAIDTLAAAETTAAVTAAKTAATNKINAVAEAAKAK